MSNTGLALCALLELASRSLSTALTMVDPAKMDADELSTLLTEIHAASTEIELFKIRAKNALQASELLIKPTIQ